MKRFLLWSFAILVLVGLVGQGIVLLWPDGGIPLFGLGGNGHSTPKVVASSQPVTATRATTLGGRKPNYIPPMPAPESFAVHGDIKNAPPDQASSSDIVTADGWQMTDWTPLEPGKWSKPIMWKTKVKFVYEPDGLEVKIKDDYGRIWPSAGGKNTKYAEPAGDTQPWQFMPGGTEPMTLKVYELKQEKVR